MPEKNGDYPPTPRATPRPRPMRQRPYSSYLPAWTQNAAAMKPRPRQRRLRRAGE